MDVLPRQFAGLAIFLVFVSVNSYRFSIPTNLFTQGPVDSSLEPEGLREIRALSLDEETDEHDEERKLHQRFRRASVQPSEPIIIESDLKGETRNIFYMYWPGNAAQDKNILLLAKNEQGPPKPIIYLSTNFGKNWTNINSRLQLKNRRSQGSVDQIYVSKLNPRLCLLADATNKHLFLARDFQNFVAIQLSWTPSFLSFHPTKAEIIAGYDKLTKKLYLSRDQGVSFTEIQDSLKAFWWGVPDVDEYSIMFFEVYKSQAKDSQSTAYKYDFLTVNRIKLLDYVDEFEVMQKYCFATLTKTEGDKKSTEFLVSYKRGNFKPTKFPVKEHSRDYFVFDVLDDQVFVVINHQRNESNMYLSDVGGQKYTLSLERVLYHNPYTDVSSPWLRTVVPYAFVDVHKVKSMRGVYLATQLTPGPVGKRHLLSMITYNRGGSWGRIRSPTRDIHGSPIYCYLPSCSLHMNLLYGSVYRISPSENLLSTHSAPGLVMALGVASTNLKIHPDVFVSTDGGANWKRALRGKHQYAFGDHGGVLMAVLYRRYTYTLRYSTNGGNNWTSIPFTSPQNKVLVEDIMTQAEEKLPIFILYGSTIKDNKKQWKLFHINLTSVLGSPCQASDMQLWVPSDDRAGLERCILGEQVEYKIRNWTKTCLMGKDYEAGKVVKSCTCRRVDFECDFGFVANTSSPGRGCVLSDDEDLDNDVIPDNCPEGTFYNRSSGYRKVIGNKCVGGDSNFFLPKKTPCPVGDLGGLSLTSSANAVKVNETVTLTASLGKGYLPNIKFSWDFGDNHRFTGSGKNAATQTHSFTKRGHYVVVLTVTNTRSILVERSDVYVEAELQSDRLSISVNPPDPSIDQEIVFVANLLNYTPDEIGTLTYTWKVDGKTVKQWQPVFKYTFSRSASYKVSVSVSNLVSSIGSSISIFVSKDIRPRSVKAVSLGSNAVSVEWQPPLEATLYIQGYKIFKSVNPKHGFEEVKAIDNGLLTHAVIYDLLPATKYYFKVMAYTAVGDGPFSDVVSATTNSTAPGIPENLHAYPTSATSIKVEWSKPKNTNQQIQQYTIHWWMVEDPRVTPKNVDGTVTSIEFTKLRQDTLYSFEVFATSAIGQGGAAGPVTARTNISKPSFPPRNLHKMANNDTCVLMKWDPPPFSQTDSRPFPAKGYRVLLDGKVYASTTSTTKWVCGLSPATQYQIGVLAQSVAGDGPASVKVITLPALRPTTPRVLMGEAKSSRSIQLTWQAPAKINGKLLNYAVYQMLPSSWAVPRQVLGTSYLVTGLLPYTQYQFAVAANNSVGLGALSSPILVTTREEIPDAPKYVTAEVVQPESATIKITWSQPKHPNGVITGYKITWRKTDVSDGGEDGPRFTDVGNSMTHTFGHLEPGTEYSFSVGARNRAGESLTTSLVVRQYTQPATEGTTRLSIRFAGALDTAGQYFPEEFYQAVSAQAQIPSERVAALEVQAALVFFNILPAFKSPGKSIQQVILALNQTFNVGKTGKTVAGSLRWIKTYLGPEPTTAVPNNKPGVIGAQRSGSSQSEKRTLALAIAIPISLIVLALMVGMAFYYRKYKNLEKHYTNMSSIYRAHNDELNIVYPADMHEDPHDRELLQNDIKTSSKKKRSHKDEERVPLEEHDELALV
ncbi:uncharacterized protein LOC5513708 [Nematostella vectensis]|uniref:uncharacterized protein LOC5513708 n=1 Tax=Nematostella vectensis TaxID=45351 RepID=UPI002077943C|nr:uncharacterized protein LOC5513708 [Nematostella vectensis]